MFQSNALHYQEDLLSMPAVPFNFYAPALAKYILSEQAKGDPDDASSFLCMIAWMLKNNRAIIDPETEEVLVDAADQAALRQEFYEADVAIYGRFSELYAEIQSAGARP